MKTTHSTTLLRGRSATGLAAAASGLLAAMLLSPTADAQRGPGGGGGGGGGMPSAFRDNIHALFENHETIERKVENTEEGYRSTTTSSDPKVAAILQEHVDQMKKRLEGGRPVRRWDPAFDEFFAHYDDLEVDVEKIDGGLRVTVTGRTPEAIAVARNHAGIVSRFAAHGWDEAHESHPAALDGDGKVVAAAAPPEAAGEHGEADCAKCAADPPAKAAKAGCRGCCRQAAAAPETEKAGPCCRRGGATGKTGNEETDKGADS